MSEATECSRRSLEFILLKVVEAFNTGDVSLVDSLFSTQYIDHQNDKDRPTEIQFDGPEEFKQIVAGARKHLPNLKVTIEDQILDKCKVAARLRWYSSDGVTEIDRETIDILFVADEMGVEHWGAEQWRNERQF